MCHIGGAATRDALHRGRRPIHAAARYRFSAADTGCAWSRAAAASRSTSVALPLRRPAPSSSGGRARRQRDEAGIVPEHEQLVVDRHACGGLHPHTHGAPQGLREPSSSPPLLQLPLRSCSNRRSGRAQIGRRLLSVPSDEHQPPPFLEGLASFGSEWRNGKRLAQRRLLREDLHTRFAVPFPLAT